ncbi:hypothetical protein QQ045_003960 [Rhodiola kirilowii]
MVEKNIALLAKWWWWLVTGKGGLWRRMIIKKYNIKGSYDPSKMIVKARKVSSTWKDIIKSVQGNSEVATAFRDGLKLKLGRGNEISFWEDVWIGDKTIRDQYPKLYQLVVDNQKKVGEMGLWVDGVWYWELSFRRNLYQWEEASKKELLEGLNHIQLRDTEDDRLVWTYSADGRYNTSSLMKAVIVIKAKRRNWEVVPFQLWSGLAPPKKRSPQIICYFTAVGVGIYGAAVSPGGALNG